MEVFIVVDVVGMDLVLQVINEFVDAEGEIDAESVLNLIENDDEFGEMEDETI